MLAGGQPAPQRRQRRRDRDRAWPQVAIEARAHGPDAEGPGAEGRDAGREDHPRAGAHLAVVRGEHEIAARAAQHLRGARGECLGVRDRLTEALQAVQEPGPGVAERPDQEEVGSEAHVVEVVRGPGGDGGDVVEDRETLRAGGGLRPQGGGPVASDLSADGGDVLRRGGEGTDRADVAPGEGDHRPGGEDRVGGEAVRTGEVALGMLQGVQTLAAQERVGVQLVAGALERAETGVDPLAREVDQADGAEQPDEHEHDGDAERNTQTRARCWFGLGEHRRKCRSGALPSRVHVVERHSLREWR